MAISIKNSTWVLLAAAVVLANTAKAEDVYVDLSVLDNLGGTAPAVSQPLFPVVKKAPAKARPHKKNVKPRRHKAPQVKVEIKEIEKIEIPVSAPAAVSAPAETPASAPAPDVEPIPYVESAEPVVVVDVEPVASQSAPVAAKKTSQPSEQPLQPEKAAAPAAPAEVAPLAQTAPTVSPLIAEGLPTAAPAASLHYESGKYELDEAQKAQIDSIIKSFEDPANHKIAINSYNPDAGEDAFAQKRVSLNRALDVRTYLIQKGYKNFSIKVLNVDAGSVQAHTVELSELK